MFEPVSTPRSSQLSGQFDDLAQLLVESRSVPLSPARVTQFVSRAVPHSAHCGLTLVHGNGRPETVAWISEVPRAVDALQYELREGPCLQAAALTGYTKVDDLATDDRWPRFARRCVKELEVRSMFSVHLVMEDADSAAVNFYAHEPGVFDELDIGVAAVFAPFAAVALQSHVNRQHAQQLEVALASSRQIGTAIGILMARELVTSEQAFTQLKEASQHLNRKLRDIAQAVTETGQLPRPQPSS